MVECTLELKRVEILIDVQVLAVDEVVERGSTRDDVVRWQFGSDLLQRLFENVPNL